MQIQETDLLKEEDVMQLVAASKASRLVNMLVDRTTFYVFLAIVCKVTGMRNPSPLTIEGGSVSLEINGLQNIIMSAVMFALFIGLHEGALKGKTLGKMLTKTRAVDEDGVPVTYAKGVARGLYRGLLIINALSALGKVCSPFHDRWTRTQVIDERESSSL